MEINNPTAQTATPKATLRPLIIFLGLLMVTLGSSVAVLATQSQQNQRLRGYVNPTQTTELPFLTPRMGVNADLTQYDPEALTFHLEQMQSAGVYWVRQEISWASIAPNPTEQNWQLWDSIIPQLSDYDLNLIAVLKDVPNWAKTPLAAEHPTAPPADVHTFAAFSAAFAARYGEHIDVYQIWDEPNLKDAWGGLDPQPSAYAALLSQSYSAIHSADTHATVLAAALAPTVETGTANLNEVLYLTALYELGAKDFMDAVSAKPYGFNAPPYDLEIGVDHFNFGRVVLLREIMQDWGDSHKAIWLSHWGWNSLPSDWQGVPSIWGNVDQLTQIEYTLASLDRVRYEFPWIAGMALQHWQPPVSTDNPLWGYALRNPEGGATPLFDALKRYHQSPQPASGFYSPTHPNASYSGVWTFGQLGADVGWLQDSKLQFEFYGQQVGLLLRKGDYVAYLYPYIDGLAPTEVPKDANNNPYIILTHPQLITEVVNVPVANSLSQAQHTLTATVDRGWDRWLLVGYTVSLTDMYQPYHQQILWSWAAFVFGIVATVTVGTQVHWQPLILKIRQWFAPLTPLQEFLIGLLSTVLLLLGMMLTWQNGIPSFFRKESVVLGLALLSGGALYLNPPFMLTLLSGAVLFVILYHRPLYTVLLTLLWAPFFLFPVQLYLYAFPLYELTLLIGFAAWILRQCIVVAQTKTLNLPRFHPLDWGAFAYLGLGIFALLQSTYFDVALTEFRTLILEPILFYVLFRGTVNTKIALERAMGALVFSALVATLIGLGMYLFGLGIITAEGAARRLAGVYGSPNNMALLIGRVLPFVLAYALLTQTMWRRWVAVGAGSVLLLAMLLTQSVGALFIGLPLSLAFVLWLRYRSKAVIPLVIMLIGFALGVAFLSQYPRFARAFDFTSGTNFFRIRVWQSAFQMIADYPLTGVGLDQFLYYFRSEYILPDAWQEPNLSHPHNIVLDFWLKLGFGGVLLLIYWQVIFWHDVSRFYAQNRQAVIGIGMLGAMLYLLAHGLIDNSIFVHDLAIIYMLLLGMSVQIQHLQAEKIISS